MLALLVATLTAAEVVCAVPCSVRAAAAAEPPAATHCQPSSSRSDEAMAPDIDCSGEHGRLAPAEVRSRRAVTTATVAVHLPRGLRPEPQCTALVALVIRPFDSAASILSPPLRI